MISQEINGRRPRAKKRSLLSARCAVAILAILLATLVSSGCSDTLSQARQADRDGDYDLAITLYEEHLAEEPDDLDALKGLAVDLFIKGDFDAALPVQEKVVDLDPKDAQIRVELGFNYLGHQDQPGRAVEVLSEAADLEPSAKYLTFLSQAQIKAGDFGAAEETLRRALDADAAYGHAYTVLLGLLETEGRTSEAAELREAAAVAGVTVD